jgi:hypothetical protein
MASSLTSALFYSEFYSDLLPFFRRLAAYKTINLHDLCAALTLIGGGAFHNRNLACRAGPDPLDSFMKSVAHLTKSAKLIFAGAFSRGER